MVTAKKTSGALASQRRIQRQQDRRDAGKARPESRAAVQAGARRQPVALPAQHLPKPGREAELPLQPRFLAPHYRGSGKLHGFVALITGADSGIGRAVAVLFAREGADIAAAYHSSTEDARQTLRCIEAEGRRCLLLRRRRGEAPTCDVPRNTRSCLLRTCSSPRRCAPATSAVSCCRSPAASARSDNQQREEPSVSHSRCPAPTPCDAPRPSCCSASATHSRPASCSSSRR